MYYIGVDISTKESALCILDGNGKIVREAKLPTDPEIIARFIAATGLAIERIGFKSGCTAAWLFAGLQRWLAVICIDAGTRPRRCKLVFATRTIATTRAASPI